MRILVICQYYYPEQFRINDICETFVKRGHEVTVLTGLPNYPMGIIPDEYKHGKKRSETINGVKVIRCSEIARKKGAVGMILNYMSYMVSASMKALFLKNEFDVVFINQLSPVLMGVPGLVFSRKSGLKSLLYSLDIWPESLTAYNIGPDSLIYKVMLPVSRAIYKRADCIAITSNSFKKYFKDVLSVEKDMIHMPQYAEAFFSNVDDKRELGKCNIVFAGNIGAVQSVETIIEAARLLKNEKNIVFHLVGDGSLYETCKENSRDLDNVKMYGRYPLEDMPKFYSMADAMLITLKPDKLLSYTVPGKLQTYMAAGKPVIGAIDGETEQVIADADCGYCVNAGDSEALAEVIKRFSNERAIHDEMGANAYKYYKENYDKEKFFDTLESALSDLCK